MQRVNVCVCMCVKASDFEVFSAILGTNCVTLEGRWGQMVKVEGGRRYGERCRVRIQQ
jgi:hypothetical protein